MVKSDISDIRLQRLSLFNLLCLKIILYFENLICLFKPLTYPQLLLVN